MLDEEFKRHIKISRENSLTSPDIMRILLELEQIKDGVIDNIYQDDNKICFKIRKRSGKFFVLMEPSVRINFTNINYNWKATNFVKMLRKHLNRKKILDIRQYRFDRIVEIDVEDGYKIVIEILSRGNFIVAKENKILFALKHVHMRDRAIYPGALLEYPPGSPEHPSKISIDILKKILIENKKILRGLLKLGLGKKYAYELLYRLKISPMQSATDLTIEEFEAIYRHMLDLLYEISHSSGGFIYTDNQGTPIIFSPIELKIADLLELNAKKFDTFSDAVDHYFAEISTIEPKTDIFKKLNEERKKLKKRIDSQREQILQFDKKIDELNTTLNVIYDNYQLILNILDTIRIAKIEKGLDWRTIRAKIDQGKKQEIAEAQAIESIHDDGTIIIRVGGKRISINFKEDLKEYISRIYERIKKLREKKVRAEEELNKAIKMYGKIEEDLQKILEEEQIIIKNPPRRWYHSFHWFISSDGYLVVGGKDIKSNEILVKRYLNDNDLFLHAEIHGGSVVIIKNDKSNNYEEIPEKTIYEAAIFAASYSKAWSKGLNAIDVYWTPPKKVSLTPPSGQYLPKGGFIIKEKHYIKDVPLILAIGIIIRAIEDEENTYEVLPISGPPEAIKQLTNYYVLIVPGTLKKFDTAKQIINLMKESTNDRVLLKALHSLKVEKIIDLIPGPSHILGMRDVAYGKRYLETQS